jgi:hypothetical protein
MTHGQAVMRDVGRVQPLVEEKLVIPRVSKR